MGNTDSLPAHHVRMYQNLLAISAPQTRIQMIQTMLSSPEHLATIRAAGIYGHLLHYVQAAQAGKAARLPGEGAPGRGTAPAPGPSHGNQLVTSGAGRSVAASQKGNDRAMNYFSACLRILGLEEEVALTEVALKAAYKKSVVRVHPDKGGSEKEFEAVTRAYAYLGDILQRIHGGRAKEGKVEAPTALASGREQQSEAWKMVEPVRLNPNKLDMNTFNTMFEKTRIPDPDETGYGDWLTTSGGADSGPKFGGKFNRDVFHRAFDDEQKGRAQQPQTGALVLQELSMSSRMGFGVELGRTKKDDFTVAANETGLSYTDLKKAYTDYNTFSQGTAGVKIQDKSLDSYTKERGKAPTPYTDHEMQALQAAERQALQAEERRRLKVAQEAVEEDSYFERMKRLVIRN